MIGQAVRGTGGQVPVVPFIWPFTGSKPMYNSYYENGTHITNGSTHASAALIRAMIEMTYEAGGAAALFWVDEVTEDKERKKNASFVLSTSKSLSFLTRHDIRFYLDSLGTRRGIETIV